MAIVLRWLLAFIAAVATTAVLGSLIQTQFNLARISGLGHAIGWSDRLEVSLFDLASFGPSWAIVVALALLIGLLVAGWPAALFPRLGRAWYALAGFVAIVVALKAMNALLPITVVAAARSSSGLYSMALAGALGGLVYAWLRGQRQNGQN